MVLKKKAYVGTEWGKRPVESESGESGGDNNGTAETAVAEVGCGGRLVHLADFKWWIGLAAIGLGAQTND